MCSQCVHSPGAPQLDTSVFTSPPKQAPDVKVRTKLWLNYMLVLGGKDVLFHTRMLT